MNAPLALAAGIAAATVLVGFVVGAPKVYWSFRLARGGRRRPIAAPAPLCPEPPAPPVAARPIPQPVLAAVPTTVEV